MFSGESRKEPLDSSKASPSAPRRPPPIPLCITHKFSQYTTSCFSPGNGHAREAAGTAPPSCIFGRRNGFKVLAFIWL